MRYGQILSAGQLGLELTVGAALSDCASPPRDDAEI
jgi:hypothetical protein